MYPVLIFYLVLTIFGLYTEYSTYKTHLEARLFYLQAASISMEALSEIQLNNTIQAEVFYLEHVLASWVLQNRPWHAYHSAIGFNVSTKDTGNVYYTVDFAPRLTEQVSSLIHPKRFSYLPYILSDVPNFLWENDAAVFTHRFSKDFPLKYINRAKIGKLSAKKFEELTCWIRSHAKKYLYFEPFEIQLLNDAGEKTKWRSSKMCHDFTSDVIEQLQQIVHIPIRDISEVLYRDRIIVFASTVKQVDMTNATTVVSVAEYYTYVEESMGEINIDFAAVRRLLQKAEGLTIQPFVYLAGEYYEVHVVEPWVNYCYSKLLGREDTTTRCLLR